MACEFSAPLLHSLRNVCFSPSCQYIASSSGASLTIRDCSTLETLQIYTCVDKIESIQFSYDSSYILCVVNSRSVVQVFSVADNDWRCRINESVAGILSAQWSPDSRHIIVESDFGIQLGIWSMLDSTSYIISSPKGGSQLLSFSDCGRYVKHINILVYN
jgi:WD40 repeat protein